MTSLFSVSIYMPTSILNIPVEVKRDTVAKCAESRQAFQRLGEENAQEGSYGYALT